jgi:hypothetical protein
MNSVPTAYSGRPNAGGAGGGTARPGPAGFPADFRRFGCDIGAAGSVLPSTAIREAIGHIGE